MSELAQKRDIGVSMRFREDDLQLIDRGAALNGLSRTEFMRRAALHEAQMAVLNAAVIKISPDAFDQFCLAIEADIAPMPDKLRERLGRGILAAAAPFNASK
jgi:uncharacterized protein (DUF1778 family)